MLNPNTVYRKTDAGMHEVQTRDLGLRAELRRLLILIDGNTPVSRLATFVRGSEIDFLIAELESQALIASDSGVSVAAQMAQTAAADTAPEPTEAQDIVAEAPADALFTITEIYPEHVVLDANHPLAGISLRLHLKVEAVREATDDELERGSAGTGFFRLQPMAPGSDHLH